MTEENGFNLENEVANSMGFESQSREVHKNTWGKPLGEVAQIRFPNIDVELFMEKIGNLMVIKSQNNEFDVILKKNLNILKHLKEQGYIIGIVTSRIQHEVEHLLAPNHDLMSLISQDDLFFRERTVFGKPDPRVYDVPLQQYGLLSSEVVYVGDSLSDAVSAKLAGFGFIASIEGKLKEIKDFPEYLTDDVVLDLVDISESIRKIEQVGTKQVKIRKDTIDIIHNNNVMSVPHDLFALQSGVKPEFVTLISELGLLV
jgi:HAD superfamily hydrolase (TIGR01549 family)